MTLNSCAVQVCLFYIKQKGTMKDFYIGIILSFLSAFTYALGSFFVQILEGKVPDLQLNFYRSIGQSILSASLLAVKGLHPLITGKQRIIFTYIVGISGAVENVLIFSSILLIPVGSAGSLFHAGCLVFTLLGVLIFRIEHVSWRKIIIFSLTLLGILLTLLSVVPATRFHFDNGNMEHSNRGNSK